MINVGGFLSTLFYRVKIAWVFIENLELIYFCQFQKENEKAKSIREQEEKYVVSAWYNIVSNFTVHRS